MSIQKIEQIREQYDALYDQMRSLLEAAAIKLVDSYKTVNSVCIAMGTVAFYDTSERHDSISEDWSSAASPGARKAILKFTDEYVTPFEDMFGPTFSPMKYVKGGEVKRDW